MKWWDRLPADLHRRAAVTPVERTHPVTTRLAALVDMGVRTGAGGLLGGIAALAGLLSRGGIVTGVTAPAACAAAWQGDPALAFPAPPRAYPVAETPVPRFGYRPPAGRPCLLAFESPGEGAGHAYAQYWRHADRLRPTLIFVHGFAADRYWLNASLFGLNRLFAAGYDILLATLPFHGYRRRRLDPFSGFGFFSRGIGGLDQALCQAVQDLRIMAAYLHDRGAPKVGVLGYSIGGYLAALLAALEPRLAFAAAICPVVSIADIAMDWPATRFLLRYLMRSTGTDLPALRAMTARHCPLSYAPLLPPERLMILAAAGDRLTTPRQVMLLHDHWGGCNLHWFPGNHGIHPVGKAHIGQLLRFMDCCTGALP